MRPVLSPPRRSPLIERVGTPTPNELKDAPRAFRRAARRAVAFAAAASFTTLWAFRMPGWPTLAILVAPLLWIAAFLQWLYGILEWSHRSAHLLLCPCLLVASVVLVYLDVPVRLALMVSERSLMRAVDACLQDQPIDREQLSKMVPFSAFPLMGVGQRFGGVAFINRQLVPWGSAGLVYDPNPSEANPPAGSSTRMRHISGRWHWWEYHGW